MRDHAVIMTRTASRIGREQILLQALRERRDLSRRRLARDGALESCGPSDGRWLGRCYAQRCQAFAHPLGKLDHLVVFRLADDTPVGGYRTIGKPSYGCP